MHAAGLWKAVDGFEVQQADSAHRFPRALGKPAYGRRFSTARTGRGVSSLLTSTDGGETAALNRRPEQRYRRFAPTACSRSPESLFTIPDPAFTISGIRSGVAGRPFLLPFVTSRLAGVAQR